MVGKGRKMIRKGTQSTVKAIWVDEQRCVRKTATEEGYQELLEQINLFRRLPSELCHHYPVVIDCNIDASDPYYVMPYYEFPSIRQLVLESQVDADFISRRIDNVLAFIVSKQHVWRRESTPERFVRKAYLERAYRRLSGFALRNDKFQRYLGLTYIELAGERYTSPIPLIAKIMDSSYWVSYLSPDIVCSTHGQLEFAHILASKTSSRDFILLDPKGFDTLLDPFYDYGKLSACSHGYLDWIDEGLFTMSEPIVESDTLVIERLEFVSSNRVEICDRIDKHWQNKLPDLYGHSFPADEIYLKTLFSEAMHLCSAVPFCFGFRDIAKAVACYVRATQSLNHFARLTGI